jgi:hypothetical protein
MNDNVMNKEARSANLQHLGPYGRLCSYKVHLLRVIDFSFIIITDDAATQEIL